MAKEVSALKQFLKAFKRGPQGDDIMGFVLGLHCRNHVLVFEDARSFAPRSQSRAEGVSPKRRH